MNIRRMIRNQVRSLCPALFPLFAIASSGCSAGAPSEGMATETSSDPLLAYGGLVKWDVPAVVCFATPDSNATVIAAKQRIKDALVRSWSDMTGLSLTGFGACPSALQDYHVPIRLKYFADEPNAWGGVAQVGKGARLDGTPVAQIEIAVGSNFNLLDSTAIHEMGHVLGFAHEQQHPDITNRCSNAQFTTACSNDMDCWHYGNACTSTADCPEGQRCSERFIFKLCEDASDVCDMTALSGNPSKPHLCIDNQSVTLPDGQKLTVYDRASIMSYCRDYDGDGNVDGESDSNSELTMLDVAGAQKLYGLDSSKSTNVWWSNWSTTGVPFKLRAMRYSFDENAMLRAGDFDGDHHDDVYIFTPGEGGDRMMWGTGLRTSPFSTGYPLSGENSYREIMVGDFNGDGRDDLFLYYPGPINDFVEYGNADRTFTQKAFPVSGTYNPVVGDFDGNGCSDIFWQDPASSTHRIWWSTCSDFTSTTISKSGTFTKLATGDFDGDGRSDIFWYAAGSADDYVWFGKTNRTFDSVEHRVDGTYTPVVGDFSGDGKDDILWVSANDERDTIWLGRSDRQLRTTSFAAPSYGRHHTVLAGKFDNDSKDDVFFFNPPN